MTSKVKSISFGILSDEELSKTSVKRIHTMLTFDSLGQPVDGGIHSPELGPLDRFDSCVTCGLSFKMCPGHIGHVELAAPVFNPVIFDTAFKLMETLCFRCHKLKAPEKQKAQVYNELKKLKASSFTRRKELQKEILSMKPSDCSSCRYISPKLRREKKHKIMQVPLSEKQEGKNVSAHLDQIAVLDDSSDSDAIEEEEKEMSLESSRIVFPLEARKHLEMLWTGADGKLVQLLFQGFNGYKDSSISFNAFFITKVVVTPNKFRPISEDRSQEHSANYILRSILESNNRIVELSSQQGSSDPDADQEQNTSHISDMTQIWLELQNFVNCLFDTSLNVNRRNVTLENMGGLKQKLDKKEGIIRRNIMGKRVNFAARSVISPDPYIRTNEIGIPDVFAKRLTFPTPVTEYNVQQLRSAVINGPEKHPGANFITDDMGYRIDLSKKTLSERTALSQTLQTSSSGTSKVVYRHLHDNDILLVNRQPTLHKPGIMAHRAKVLRNQKTIRMHYANCNTYNADFDGDEINLHFPQDHIARSEAYNIAATPHQYLVPKNGAPLRGLIQDHVVSGVLITKKDTFIEYEQYQQLLYIGCVGIDEEITRRISIPEPAIIKPRPLWTGKQLISALLQYLTHSKQPLTMKSKCKVAGNTWGDENVLEGQVYIKNNELIHGVLDKSQFGASAYGLVHLCYELYGPNAASALLTSLGRLFTTFIQMRWGFTCGLDDLLLQKSTEKSRIKRIKDSVGESVKASSKFVKDLLADNEEDPEKVKNALKAKFHSASAEDQDSLHKSLDSNVKSVINGITSQIIKDALKSEKGGLCKPFPHNSMSLMTMSGAKGSNVNQSQISCLLGQQELEGRRVPRLPTGRSLPSFEAFDPSARSGGFISDRFLTGIRPQEYYFHCMAGREGLVDTAVKTSRSGYLQRCLVKHLENIRVHYDLTVRDDAHEGRVIQFLYGEDSIDVMKSGFLFNTNQYGFLEDNYKAQLRNLNPRGALEALDTETIPGYIASMDMEKSDPVISLFSPACFLGSVSERFQALIEEHETSAIDAGKFRAMMYLKYLQSLIHPGEPVGVLTAQSIGEPSTQMTLNTFHLAGFGGANVTLGIPRLREIIMTASAKISTPLMQIYLNNDMFMDKEGVEKLANTLRRVSLGDVVDGINIEENFDALMEFRETKVILDISQERKQKFGISNISLSKKVRYGLIPLLSSEHSFDDFTATLPKEKQSIGDDDTEELPVAISAVSDSEPSDDDESQNADYDDDSDQDNSKQLKPFVKASRASSFEPALVSVKNSKITFTIKTKANQDSLLDCALVEQKCDQCILREIRGISNCYITQPSGPSSFASHGEYAVQTDGRNYSGIWLQNIIQDLNIDTSRMYTNDIALALKTFGVEAARILIMKEIAAVFNVYGITVDSRHLSLLADYMTNEGEYRPLNRYGIAGSDSPLLKMSYETSTGFLTNAIVSGESDPMKTASSRLFTGSMIPSGTGCFDLRQPISL